MCYPSPLDMYLWNLMEAFDDPWHKIRNHHSTKKTDHQSGTGYLFAFKVHVVIWTRKWYGNVRISIIRRDNASGNVILLHHNFDWWWMNNKRTQTRLHQSDLFLSRLCTRHHENSISYYIGIWGSKTLHLRYNLLYESFQHICIFISCEGYQRPSLTRAIWAWGSIKVTSFSKSIDGELRRWHRSSGAYLTSQDLLIPVAGW